MMSYQHRRYPRTLALVLFSFLAVAMVHIPSASATELYIPPLEAQRGRPIDVPIMIDSVDNLAGVKLVMKYDPQILVFRKGSKTEHSSSMMHIVNDKKPGLLIAVMAAAKGIKGKNMPILSFTFDVKKDAAVNPSVRLEIIELQLMSDTLKEIKCTIKIGKLTISGK